MSQRIEMQSNKNFGLETWKVTDRRAVIFLVEGKLLTTWEGKQLESTKIKYDIEANLSQDDFIKRVGSYAREMLGDNIAVFPYPRNGEIQEFWVFEAFV